VSPLLCILFGLAIGIGTKLIFMTDFKRKRDRRLKFIGMILLMLGVYGATGLILG